LKSRALGGLAVLVVGALVATFTVSRGASDAATPAGDIGTSGSATNTLTVNVQEVPGSEDGSSGVFNLSEFGNLDWFHLTGVPGSNPYYDPPDPSKPIGGYRAVMKDGADVLTWSSLFTGPSPSGTDYTGVYESSTSPLTYVWDPTSATDELVNPSPNPANPVAAQTSGNHLEGVFYDPENSPDPGGYTIKVTANTASDSPRVLRFVGGIWEASAEVTVTAIDASGVATDTAVAFYPKTVKAPAGQAKANALYTIYIPAGYGAEVKVAITTSASPLGHVTLGGAALTDEESKLAVTSGLALPSELTAIEVPATWSVEDPGGSGLTVDAWRHTNAEWVNTTSQGVEQFQYGTYYFARMNPASESVFMPIPQFDVVNAACNGYLTLPLNGLRADPSPTTLPAPYEVVWTNRGGGRDSTGLYSQTHQGNAAGYTAPTSQAIQTMGCAGQHGMAKITVDETAKNDTADRYLYVLAGAWGGTLTATATFDGAGDPVEVLVSDALDDPAELRLFRVLAPAGATGAIEFGVDPTEGLEQSAYLVIGGASIQHVPAWQSCSLPTGADTYEYWAEFLTSEDSADLARSPYFQQFQLRALLNSLITTASPPLPELTKFDQARLAAAFCEAKAWPEDPTTSVDLHPDQNGYGEGHDQPQGQASDYVQFGPEDDEAKALTGDENDGDPADSLSQPMVRLTKRAFTCDAGLDDEDGIDPNDIIDSGNGVEVDFVLKTGCTVLAAGDTVPVPSGTRVYWVYTVTNIALFGGLNSPDGTSPLTVTDTVTSPSSEARTCVLNWELAPPATPASPPAAFPATEVDEGDLAGPITPQNARACVISEVLW
jgi:hypothetical protein